MLAGKFNRTLRSAAAAPPIAADTLLLLRLLSAIAVTTALTAELPEAGWTYPTLMGPIAPPAAIEIGMPVRVMTPVAAL